MFAWYFNFREVLVQFFRLFYSLRANMLKYDHFWFFEYIKNWRKLNYLRSCGSADRWKFQQKRFFTEKGIFIFQMSFRFQSNFRFLVYQLQLQTIWWYRHEKIECLIGKLFTIHNLQYSTYIHIISLVFWTQLPNFLDSNSAWYFQLETQYSYKNTTETIKEGDCDGYMCRDCVPFLSKTFH